MTADPKLIAPELLTAYETIAPQFAQSFPGSVVQIIQGYRTPQMQREALNSGASNFDGMYSFSKHQTYPAQAIDLGVFQDGGVYITNGADARYSWLGQEFEREGFGWGGRWKRPDFDHVEILGANPTKAQVLDGFIAMKAMEEKNAQASV
jgi:D-alanyl-D-alanine carboxypeptidase